MKDQLKLAAYAFASVPLIHLYFRSHRFWSDLINPRDTTLTERAQES